MTVTTSAEVSEETYRRLALGELNGRLELHDGRLREKPGMSAEHGDLMTDLMLMLHSQLDRNDYRLRARAFSKS